MGWGLRVSSLTLAHGRQGFRVWGLGLMVFWVSGLGFGVGA